MERRVYHACRSEPEIKTQSEKIRPFKTAVLLIAQEAGVPACVAGAEARHPALAGGRNLQGEVGRCNQVQAEVADQALALSVVVELVLVLGVGVTLHQGGVETSDRGLARIPEDGFGGPWGLVLGLDRSSRLL